nr:MAG TPA: hypothetical protein [Caudoviricetes sp.]
MVLVLVPARVAEQVVYLQCVHVQKLKMKSITLNIVHLEEFLVRSTIMAIHM